MSNPNYKCHLFICTQVKEKGSCCGAKSSAALRADLKKRIEEKFPDKKHLFRINASGCLGKCELGIASVIYPSGDWKLNLKDSDIESIQQWVESYLTESF